MNKWLSLLCAGFIAVVFNPTLIAQTLNTDGKSLNQDCCPAVKAILHDRLPGPNANTLTLVDLQCGADGVYLATTETHTSNNFYQQDGLLYKFDFEGNLTWRSRVGPSSASFTSKLFRSLVETSSGGVMAVGDDLSRSGAGLFIDAYDSNSQLEFNDVNPVGSAREGMVSVVRHPAPKLAGFPYYVIQKSPYRPNVTLYNEDGDYHGVSGDMVLPGSAKISGALPQPNGDLLLTLDTGGGTRFINYKTKTVASSSQSNLSGRSVSNKRITKLADSGKGYYVGLSADAESSEGTLSIAFISQTLSQGMLLNFTIEKNACPNNTALDLSVGDGEVVVSSKFCDQTAVFNIDLPTNPFSVSYGEWYSLATGYYVAGADDATSMLVASDKASGYTYAVDNRLTGQPSGSGPALYIQRLPFNLNEARDCFEPVHLLRVDKENLSLGSVNTRVAYPLEIRYQDSRQPSSVTAYSGASRPYCGLMGEICGDEVVVNTNPVISIAKADLVCRNYHESALCEGLAFVRISGNGVARTFISPASESRITFSTEGMPPGTYSLMADCDSGCIGVTTFHVD